MNFHYDSLSLSPSLSPSLSLSVAGDKEVSAMSSRGGGGDLHLRELLMEKTGEVHKLKAELDKYVDLLVAPTISPSILIERLHHTYSIAWHAAQEH